MFSRSWASVLVNERGIGLGRVTHGLAIERIARELHRDGHPPRHNDPLSVWEDLSDDFQAAYRDQARRLLTAMWTPGTL